jgi:predicted nuclease with TOPRIM domain
MESTMVWILIFAGAAIGLLGLFLFASERELKVRRREIETLSAKLNESSSAQTDQITADHDDVATNLSAELTAQNKELSEQITALTSQSENHVAKLQEAELRLRSMETEVAQLQSSYQRLENENARLKSQLVDSEERLQEPLDVSLELSERYSQMEAEIRELSQELKKSSARVRELENLQKRFSEFHDSALSEHQSLVTRIGELENELTQEKEKLVDFDVTQSRLIDIERRYLLMHEENTRLREEIIRWEDELSESQEHQSRLALVRQHLDQLELEQAAVTEQQGKIQEQMAALGKLLSGVPQGDVQLGPGANLFRNGGHSVALQAAECRAPSSTEHMDDAIKQDNRNKMTENTEHQGRGQQDSQSEHRTLHPSNASTHANGKHSYKILVVLTPALLIVGTVMAGFLRNHSIESEVTVASTPTITPTSTGSSEPKGNSEESLAIETPRLTKDASSISVQKGRATQVFERAGYARDAQVKTVAATSSGPNTPVEESLVGKPTVLPPKPIQQASNPSPAVWGGYEIIRSTQVYSEATENSQPVARLNSGAQVNVVSARDGWLEIRSKNGRPPGFIKSETAVRIGKN